MQTAFLANVNFIHWKNMEPSKTLCVSLVLDDQLLMATLVTRILDTFMFRLNMPDEIILLLTLISISIYTLN